LTETRRRRSLSKPLSFLPDIQNGVLRSWSWRSSADIPRRWRLSKSVKDKVFAVLEMWVVIKSIVRRNSKCGSSVSDDSLVQQHRSQLLNDSKQIVPIRPEQSMTSHRRVVLVLEDTPGPRSHFLGVCAKRTGISEKGVLTEITLSKSLRSSGDRLHIQVWLSHADVFYPMWLLGCFQKIN
jgi:hypothetical protein